VFPLDKMREYTQNYIKAGGKRAFSEYYMAKYDGAQFQRSLIENVVFAQHNLVSDHSFNEFNVIICRNVMIYFDRALQTRVHQLFYDSLERFGILAARSQGVDPLHRDRERVRGARRPRAAVPEGAMRTSGAHELVAIGASWGGLDVLRDILRDLPAELNAAVVIAQHRSPDSHPTAMRDLLGSVTRLRVAEAGDKDEIRPGTAYIAAPDYHLLVEPGLVTLSTDRAVAVRAPVDRRAVRDRRRVVPRPVHRHHPHRRERRRRARPGACG